MLASACTAGSDQPLPPSSPGAPKAQTVTALGRSYVEECLPAAEALVDVRISPPASRPVVRAIAGLWDAQGVAVYANDPHGCGVWELALASGLSTQARQAIEAEVDDGVGNFGVVASPVPKDPNNGMEG